MYGMPACCGARKQGNVANPDDVNRAISQSPRKIGGVIQLALALKVKRHSSSLPVYLSLFLSS